MPSLVARQNFGEDYKPWRRDQAVPRYNYVDRRPVNVDRTPVRSNKGSPTESPGEAYEQAD
jgi:hypothetical protein